MHKKPPWKDGSPEIWYNFFRIVGVKGEVWSIFPGYVGKIIDIRLVRLW